MSREVLEQLEEGIGRMLLMWDSTSDRLGPGQQYIHDYINRLANSIVAVSMGHMEQVELYYHLIIHKKKTPINPTNIADVATTDRSVQLKVVNRRETSGVQDHLETAIKQIAGVKGEQPLPEHKRQVLIYIWPEGNGWPFDNWPASPPPQKSFIEQELINKIRNAVNAGLNAIPSNPRNSNSLSNFFDERKNIPVAVKMTKTTARTYEASTRHPPESQKWDEISNLTVRVRWPRGRLIRTPQGLDLPITGFKASVARPTGFTQPQVRIVKWYELSKNF